MSSIDTTLLTPADIPPTNTRAIAAWLAFWAAFGAMDWYAHKRGRTTLSKAGRHLFRVHTPTGRLLFTAVFVGGSAALWHHVVREGQR
jgi:hypothetical protein